MITISKKLIRFFVVWVMAMLLPVNMCMAMESTIKGHVLDGVTLTIPNLSSERNHNLRYCFQKNLMSIFNEAIPQGDLDQLKGLADTLNYMLYQKPNVSNEENVLRYLYINGKTFLFRAVSCNQPRIVQYLLDCGLNVNEQYSKKNNMTPLIIAAANGYTECVKILLEKGASFDLRHNEHDYTVLHFAAQNGHLGTVKKIVELVGSTCVDVLDRHGRSPLYLAASRNWIGVVRYFIEECHASVDLKIAFNVEGFDQINFFEFLILNGSMKIVRYLLLTNGVRDKINLGWGRIYQLVEIMLVPANQETLNFTPKQCKNIEHIQIFLSVYFSVISNQCKWTLLYSTPDMTDPIF